MALGENTKCDLSAGIAKLDLETLKTQMEIHFYSQMEKVRKQTSNVLNNFLTQEDKDKALLSMTSHGSQSLMSATQNISEIAELLHTLYNTDDREIVIIRTE